MPQPQLPPRLPRLPAPTLLLLLALLPGAGASPVVGNSTAARGARAGLPPLPTPSAGCRKPESPCQTALKAQCGHARLQGGNDMCERCAGRQEGPLKKAGCTDKDIDLFCQPCLPLNCHNEQHTILVHDPLIGPVERHYRVHLPPSYFLTGRLPHAVVIDFHGAHSPRLPARLYQRLLTATWVVRVLPVGLG